MKIEVGQIWTHYKNPKHTYEIICLGRNSENLEEVVIYKNLFPSETGMGDYWVRPKTIFLGKVVVDGKEIDRFSLVEE